MQFAYLTPVRREDGGGLCLVPANPGDVDGPALPKARTLLFLLHEHKRLSTHQSEFRDQKLPWLLHYGSNVDQSLGATIPTGPEQPEIWAVVPLKPRAAVQLQPGLALVRNTFEATMLFTEWLEGSRRWVENNAQTFQGFRRELTK